MRFDPTFTVSDLVILIIALVPIIGTMSLLRYQVNEGRSYMKSNELRHDAHTKMELELTTASAKLTQIIENHAERLKRLEEHEDKRWKAG